jgi:hypothetical protein
MNQYNYKKDLDKQLYEKEYKKLNEKREEQIWNEMESNQIKR